MDDKTLWGVITLVFTMGYGAWLMLRFGDNQRFALKWIDGAYFAAFIVLMACYAAGFFPIPSALLALAVGGIASLGRFAYRWYSAR